MQAAYFLAWPVLGELIDNVLSKALINASLQNIVFTISQASQNAWLHATLATPASIRLAWSTP